MHKAVLGTSLSIVFIALIFSQINCTQQQEKTESNAARIAHGKYLVNFGGCNDCHSPKVFTAEGPVFDTTRLLSGIAEGTKLPIIEKNMLGPDKWILTNGESNVWVGPWGISYPANLTPDKETGIGNWTEAIFIKTMRTGKHLGEGRPILPPMPWPGLAQLKDQDLKDIFAYLQSLKPIKNKVPDPVTPDEIVKFVSVHK